MSVPTPRLERINLRKADRHEHPDIKVGSRYLYLARWGGNYYLGSFSRQHYGLNFDCDFGFSGLQFDAPGYNASLWEGLWRVRTSR